MGEIRLDRCCRLCLKEGFSLTNIFSHRSAAGDPLYRILSFIYDIKIVEDDGLPSQICSPCMWRMIEFEACKRNVRCAEAEIIRLLDKTRPDEANQVKEVGIECVHLHSDVPIKEEMDLEEWEMPVETVMKQVSEPSQQFEEGDGLESTQMCTEISYVRKPLKSEDVGENLTATQECTFLEQPKLSESIGEVEVLPAKKNKRSYVCDVCNKSCFSKHNLGQHVRTHYGEQPFTCAVCGKKFKYEQGRKDHELRHLRDGITEEETQKKLHSCGICGKNFSFKESLYRHINRHGDKFSCASCGKSFDGNASLKRHARVHTKEKPFKCEVCARCFSEKGSLKVHMATHSSERPYTCSVCDRRFKLKFAKDRHELLHLKKE